MNLSMSACLGVNQVKLMYFLSHCTMQPQSCKRLRWTEGSEPPFHARAWPAKPLISVTSVRWSGTKPFVWLHRNSADVLDLTLVSAACQHISKTFSVTHPDGPLDKIFVWTNILHRWCSGYILALDWGGHVETWVWRRERRGDNAEGNGALSRWAAGCPAVHSSSSCAAKTLDEKWKCSEDLSIFTRIILCLSVILLFPLPLSSPFYPFVALASGHSCEDRRDGSAPPLTPPRFTVQQLDNQPVPTSHSLVSTNPDLRVLD